MKFTGGKPVPGFGDLNSKIAIIGLAPAAHGGTRTGRAFTGDKSSDFLFRCLHEVGISNLPFSKNLNDNLRLNSTYVTNILKCVPPEDKPLKKELDQCFKYFNQEINFLKDLKVIVALGKIAFDACKYFYKKKINLNQKIKFGHGKIYSLKNGIKMVGCYHPSPRNVNTGRINEKKMVRLFQKIKDFN